MTEPTQEEPREARSREPENGPLTPLTPADPAGAGSDHGKSSVTLRVKSPQTPEYPGSGPSEFQLHQK